MKLTDGQLQTMRHMLGIDKPEERAPEPYRNYFCASAGDAYMADLAETGAVEQYSSHNGYDWYRCTQKGRALAIKSHKSIRLPKSKRVYSRFLEVSDSFPDLTFKEFLTLPEFKESRRAA